ncbi:MAG: hypothetical protein ABI268_06870 [Rhodanobacter sp.]
MRPTLPRPFDRQRARRQGLMVAVFFYMAGWGLLRLQAQHPMVKPWHWPLLVNFLIAAPLIYLWLNRRAGRQAWFGALAIWGLGVFVGSRMLPADPLLHELGLLRIVGVGAALIFELAALGGMIVMLRRLASSTNPEARLCAALDRRLPQFPLKRLLQSEARMWLHCLGRSSWRWRYTGEKHYRYGEKDARASNQRGVIYLLVLGLPADHLLLHLFSPAVAWSATFATLYLIVYLIADYRASHRRPISTDARTLYLRHGIGPDLILPTEWIASVESYRGHVGRRPRDALRFGSDPHPNMKLVLREARELIGPLGTTITASVVFFSVDQPIALLDDLHARLGLAALAS